MLVTGGLIGVLGSSGVAGILVPGVVTGGFTIGGGVSLPSPQAESMMEIMPMLNALV